jgi:serine/threonine protein kinase
MSINLENQNNIKNNNNNSKEEEEKDTKDDSQIISSKDSAEEKIIELIPGKQILNDVQTRFFILSPTVELGFERECNKYDFIRDKKPLGKGAFGEVWKVTHENSKKIYCIKMMSKREIYEQQLINQINKEISIMYNINHPYSIKLYNHFEDNDKLYLIMEPASNGNLYSFIENNKNQKIKSNETIKKIIIQTIEIIKYLHSKDIIYRDIKPENILLDKDNNIKLCDYGWASYLTKDQFCKVYCGTPEYVSPEMVKKYPYNEKVDIWGIGVLIFELLFGYPPFSSNFNEDRYNNIKEGKINWPQEINDKDAKDLIGKILKINPNERLSLEEIEKHPWLISTYNKMKEDKQTNDTFENKELTQTQIYKNNIMNNGISKLFNSDKKSLSKLYSYNELENDGSFSTKEILNIYKIENKQLRLKILKVEEDNKNLQKKCCDYNDVCYLNKKLNKKIDENNKQILSLKSKCLQKDEIIKDKEKKITELLLQNNEYKKLENIKKEYRIMEEELINLKKILEQKNININNNTSNEEDIKIFLNNFLDGFKLENSKLSIYNQTKNNLTKEIIKNQFDEHSKNIKNIFEKNSFDNSKAYQIIEYLNNKMEELYGYKTKAERYQSQTEMLLNEQKILKEQIIVYRKIVTESKKMTEFVKESKDQYKKENDVFKDIIQKTKKYIQTHFSIVVQNELFKLLENN